MLLKCQSFKNMAEEICRANLYIVMFGCGMIGRITTPEILKQYGLLNRVIYYVDNDKSLWDGSVDLFGQNIPVKSPISLKKMKNIVVLLNISRYAGVLEQLESYKELKDTPCYLMPMMCIDNFQNSKILGAMKDTDHAVIPKILNYIWIGGNSLSNSQKRCIASWRKFCPDYEIRLWDESNYDFQSNQYMAEAYEKKAYGFVSDTAKLDILYRFGGFYLDTDVELIKPVDDLRYQRAFCGVEKWQTINFGGLNGAEKGNEAIRKYLDSRQNLRFINPDGTENRTTCGYYDTKTALGYGYKLNGQIQKVEGMNVYPSDYFHPYDYMTGQTKITKNTYAIHHFGGSWLSPAMVKENRRSRETYQILHQIALRNNK